MGTIDQAEYRCESLFEEAGSIGVCIYTKLNFGVPKFLIFPAVRAVGVEGAKINIDHVIDYSELAICNISDK
jgi:hypothetical protein